MSISEKIAAKIGAAIGAMSRTDLTPEQRKKVRKQAYEETMASRHGTSSCGSSSYRASECCANCYYFTDFIDDYCTKHEYTFTASEQANDVKYSKRCSSYRPD